MATELQIQILTIKGELNILELTEFDADSLWRQHMEQYLADQGAIPYLAHPSIPHFTFFAYLEGEIQGCLELEAPCRFEDLADPFEWGGCIFRDCSVEIQVALIQYAEKYLRNHDCLTIAEIEDLLEISYALPGNSN